MKKSEIFQELLESDFNFSGTVCIDSRLLKKGDIFFAIRKGNAYVESAIQKGCYPIYDEGEYIQGKKVDDTVAYMQKLASEYRNRLKATVIGITGSNGKTTVKDVVAYLLENSYKTEGNHNNLIGEPLTILNCPIEAKYLVLEMGMSAINEIDRLASIAKPDYSIITNIGDSHLEFLKTHENVFRAKCEIIPHTKKSVVVSGEDKYLKTLDMKNIIKVKLGEYKISDYGSEFIFSNIKYKTNLYGRHNALDICLALALLKEMNEKIDKKKIENLKITDMRFQIIEKNAKTYINDAYNAAPKSMESSLLTLNEIFKDKKKYLVLGDMLELGENEIKYHEDLAKVLDKINYEKVYLYGPLMKHLKAKNCVYVVDKKQIKDELDKLSNIIVFLKGSRGMRLEEIIGDDD